MVAQPLSNLQLELLKAFSMQTIDENDIKEIKIMLSKYFARKTSMLAQEYASNQQWTKEKIENLATEHHRTSK